MRLVYGRVVHCHPSTHCTPCKTQTLTDFTVLDDGPFEALDVDADSKQGREQDDSFQAESLAFVVFGFGRPVQERDDILGHL